MPGIGNITIGLGICLVGIVITAATYAAAPGGYYVVAYGAILVGGLQFLAGAFEWLRHAISSKESKATHHAGVDINVLLRSMVATAAADDSLADNEIAIIQMVCRQVTGAELDPDTVKNVFEEMKGHDFADELGRIRSQVTSEGAELAVKCCLLVAFADGDFDESEDNRIGNIAGTLGVTGDRFKRCAEEATGLYQAILSTATSQTSSAKATGAG